MGLKDYWQKRDFTKTREPKGSKQKQDKHRFMVHEHHASILHFDFRMEIGGVAKSWSIPRGPSMNPRERRLAVQVEDHPVAYMAFEGEIPEGEYGGGLSLIWDSGTFEPEGDPLDGWNRGSLAFTLKGKNLKGGFVLFKMKGRQQNGKPLWLLVKKKDEFADQDWKLTQRDPRGALTKRGGARPASRKRKISKAKARAAEAISTTAFRRKRELEGDISLKIGRDVVELTSLDK